MNIKGINNKFPYSQDYNNPKVDKTGKKQPKDKLEISAEAKALSDSTKNDEKLKVIEERVESKFYDSDDVIQKVADKILKVLKSK